MNSPATAAASGAGPERAPTAPGAPGSALPPLSGVPLVVGTFALSVATFMVILDTSIANVSIPAISGDLGVSASQGTWVITSFAVANAISVPLTGWLTQRFGPVRLFTLSTLLFVLGSWLCGLATNIEMLILFRVLQGLFAGPLIPLSQALLLASYPPKKSGIALAMWSLTTLVAPVMGPLLGGYITDAISWEWIFYINVPVGLFAAYLTWGIYRHREAPTRKVPVDVIGLVLLVVWAGSLQVMLDTGKEQDWFESTQIILLCLVAVVGLVLFVIWELTDEHPVVNLRLFARPNFLWGTQCLAIAFGVFFANIVILPLWLQTQMGYTATDAGYVVAPVGLLAIPLAPVVGHLVGRVDPRRIATTAFLLFALVCWMRAQFNAQVDLPTLIMPTIVQGATVACFFIPLMTITLSGLPPSLIPSASGLINFARITAGAFGTSIATTTWDNRAALHHSQLVEAIGNGNPASNQMLAAVQAAGLDPTQGLALLDRMINVQAYVLSADEIYYVSALIFIALVPFIWFAHPGKGGAADSGGAH